MFQQATSSQLDINRTKALLAWKRQPNTTDAQARLLGGAGEITLRLHQLPLPLIAYIAGFLYSERNPGTPSIWLIFSTLYQQIQLSDQEEEETKSRQNMQSLYFNLFKKRTETGDQESASASSETSSKLNDTQFLNALKEDSAHLVIMTATRAACRLTVSNNEKQLLLVVTFGTYAQKNFTLLYLLRELENRYACLNSHKNELQYYTAAVQYVNFIEMHFSTWIESLKATKKNANNTIENELIRDYPKYMSCAREIIFKSAAIISQSSVPERRKPKTCSIS